MTTKFVIYRLENGFLLNIYSGSVTKSYQYPELIKVLAHIDEIVEKEGKPSDTVQKSTTEGK